jgi:hypothetical protein
MSAPQEFRIFLSGVTSEFGKARSEIANDLSARGLLVKVQHHFRQEADTETTLAKLNKYISECFAVVHIAGARSGSFPGGDEAKPFRHILPPGVACASYTQWEFYLARHHQRRLSIYIAKAGYQPDEPDATISDNDTTLQSEHIRRLEKLDRDYFATTDELCRRVLCEDWPIVPIKKPRNLPFASLGSLFKGRDAFLDRLHETLTRDQEKHAAAVTGKALHGLGGIGKTRLAVEYALRHEREHSALLFVPAETPERLSTGLAALAGPDILDLPEKDAREDEVKIPAALNWLEHHPGWLMILDNVDDDKAAAAVEDFVARLKGGHVLITGRTGDFSAAIETFPLDVLSEDDAANLLLDATKKREKAANDGALAHELARELGGLALALAQACAYIDRQRMSFTRYLKLWRETRETVLTWFDKRLVSYNHDVGLATTWAASVEKLTPPGRRLLGLCAFLDPAPIPKFLLDVPVPAPFDAHDALADLFAYSLASQVDTSDAKAPGAGFAVHRLVQDFTKRGMLEEHRREVLKEALGWVSAAFTGDPEDVRTWPVLDPLSLHALTLLITVSRLGSTSRLRASTANSACCSKGRRAMRKPSCSCNARWPSVRRAMGLIIPTSLPASTISPNCCASPTALRRPSL